MNISNLLVAVSCASLFSGSAFADRLGDINRGGRVLLLEGSWQDSDVEKSVENCLKPQVENLYQQIFKEAPQTETVCSTEFPEITNIYPSKIIACDIETPANNGQLLRLSTNSKILRDFTPRLGPGNNGFKFVILPGSTPDENDGARLDLYSNRFLLVEETIEVKDEFGRVTSSETSIIEVETSPATTTKMYDEVQYFLGGNNRSFTSEFSMTPAEFSSCFEAELASRSRN